MSYWIVLLVSLLACSVGFHMYIWFFSVGYGLAIAAIGVALAVGFHSQMVLPEWIACGLLFVFGLRLSGYLLIREMKNTIYRKVLNPEMERSKRMPIFAKIAMWLTCGVLYTLMTIPSFFRLKNGRNPMDRRFVPENSVRNRESVKKKLWPPPPSLYTSSYVYNLTL